MISYEETPVPGAYQFVGKDGNKWMLTGAPADDLKKKLDAANALMPQPVAGPGTGVVDPARLSSLMNAQAAASPEGQARAKLEGDLAGSGPVAPAPAPGASQPAPSAPSPAGGMKPIGAGLFEGPDGTIYENRAPTAGSKGGLVLRSETRQGVQPVDPAFLAGMDELQKKKMAELGHQQSAQLDRAEEERKYKEAQEVIAANEQAEAARRQQEIETRLADLQGRYDEAEKDVANAKVDPDKASNFMDTIAMALGAIGATLQKQPNMVAEIVQAKINRRIRAQETELDVRRGTKNDLARMLEVTQGNRDMARQALSAAYMKKAAATFEARAANTSNQELKATMGLAALNAQDAYMVRRKGLENAGRGEITQTFVNTPAQAASAGGLTPVRDQLGARGKVLDLKQKEKELAESGAGGEGSNKPIGTERTEKITAMVEGYRAAKDVQERFKGQEGNVDDPTFGPIDSLFNPGDRKATDREARKLAKGYQAARGKSDTDAKLAMEDAVGTGSVNERVAAAEAAEEETIQGIVNEISTEPPATQQKLLQAMPDDVRALVARRIAGATAGKAKK